MKKGKIIVISGPSGVGKSTIVNSLLKDDSLNVTYSISMTTRNKREGEVDGKNYFFVSNDEFIKAINNNELIEWTEYANNKYGTPKNYLDNTINQGKNIILEIDVVGAMNILNIFGMDKVISIFILPKDFNVVEQRLLNRGTEQMETIDKRLQIAKKEFEYKDKYKYQIINDDLNTAINDIKNIIIEELK